MNGRFVAAVCCAVLPLGACSVVPDTPAPPGPIPPALISRAARRQRRWTICVSCSLPPINLSAVPRARSSRRVSSTMCAQACGIHRKLVVGAFAVVAVGEVSFDYARAERDRAQDGRVPWVWSESPKTTSGNMAA